MANAIQMREAIDKLIDRTKSPRFNDNNYYEAINQSIKLILNDRVENIKKHKRYSVQSSQRLRNELYTLVPPTVTITPTGNVVAFPPDYFYLLAMQNTVNGDTNVCWPTDFNESGLLERNPFKRPKSYKTYYQENNAGWVISLPLNATFSASLVDYIKLPKTVYIGTDSNKIFAGAGVLTTTSVYIVYDEVVHNGVTYYEGQTFTAANTNLTSGTVILNSIIVNCDLPIILHDEIIRGAGAIMNGTVEDWQKEMDLKNQNKES